MRRLDHHRHVPRLDLFRPTTPTLEWRQLPAEVRGKAARMLRERQHPRANDEPAGGRDDE